MKLFSEAAQAAIEDGTAVVSGAVQVLCDPPFRAWGGYGDLVIGGETYTGIGDRGLVQSTGASVGGAAQGVTLALSDIEPAVIDLVDADAARGAPVTMWRLIFDGSGTQLLDAQVFMRGRIDELPTDETAGGSATLSAAIETAARGLGRRGGRTRSDPDQRLISAADGGFKNVSYAAQKTLYWGGHGPQTAGSTFFSNQSVTAP